MKHFKIALVVLGVAFGGYQIGRAQGKASSEVQQMGQAEFNVSLNRRPEDFAKLTEFYVRIPKSETLTKYAIRSAVVAAASGDGKKSDAVLISQNAEIIRLLKAKK